MVTPMSDAPGPAKASFSYFAIHDETPCVSGSVEAALRGGLCGFLLGSAFAKVVLAAPEGPPPNPRGAGVSLKQEKELLTQSRWLMLLASRHRLYEAQQRNSQLLLQHRRLLLRVTESTSAVTPAAAATPRHPPTSKRVKSLTIAWLGGRVACVLDSVLESTLYCVLERDLRLSPLIVRPATWGFVALYLHRSFLNQKSIFAAEGKKASTRALLKGLLRPSFAVPQFKQSFLMLVAGRALFDFATAAAASTVRLTADEHQQ
ncbi:hypothetical protein cyc_03144 [Cyclospora cayetanensis]|uniref:Uncharacterized protein n=1 Tax=Cyclospora cayetanensis TaxID=88456 RepID=A0A1D3D796_9EIME|nr:hypothetical protein cyc_03144 [Cyclospora cayetanensis]